MHKINLGTFPLPELSFHILYYVLAVIRYPLVIVMVSKTKSLKNQIKILYISWNKISPGYA